MYEKIIYESLDKDLIKKADTNFIGISEDIYHLKKTVIHA